MTKNELRNIEVLKQLTSDIEVLNALINWLPSDELDEFIEDYIVDNELEYLYCEDEQYDSKKY